MPPLFCINISGFRHTSGAKPDFSRVSAGYEKDAVNQRLFNQMADRVGFEPTVPFGGTHDFQSCTFGLSVICPLHRFV